MAEGAREFTSALAKASTMIELEAGEEGGLFHFRNDLYQIKITGQWYF